MLIIYIGFLFYFLNYSFLKPQMCMWLKRCLRLTTKGANPDCKALKWHVEELSYPQLIWCGDLPQILLGSAGSCEFDPLSNLFPILENGMVDANKRRVQNFKKNWEKLQLQHSLIYIYVNLMKVLVCLTHQVDLWINSTSSLSSLDLDKMFFHS